jgi:glycine hydroxymethyltransferase
VAQDLTARLRTSLRGQEQLLRSSLILNPVENVPFADDLAVVAGPLHGLYNTDKVRSREQRVETNLQFAGREALETDSREIYTAWAEALHAQDVTLRVLSGLHAHIVLFMAMAVPGETVLLLPIEGGGHLSGKAILERLGLTVLDMVIDHDGMQVDMDETMARHGSTPPDYVFVDRSEGLVYEDFSPLSGLADRHAIFDLSQYLTNVMCGDHENPFDWGFDLMVASVHKNFPGPQKALLATREDDAEWRRILGGVSTYVSNMHVASTYVAGLTLDRQEWLAEYSRDMLAVAMRLEQELRSRGVPVIERPLDRPPTHHVWIAEGDKAAAFQTYERLEQALIMTNYRLLPYGLGYGLRLGVSAAVRLGMREDDTPRLAEIMAELRHKGCTSSLAEEARSFSQEIWSRSE